MSSLMIIIFIYLSITALACKIPGLPSERSALPQGSKLNSKLSSGTLKSPKSNDLKKRPWSQHIPLDSLAPPVRLQAMAPGSVQEEGPVHLPPLRAALSFVGYFGGDSGSLASGTEYGRHVPGITGGLETTSWSENRMDGRDHAKLERRIPLERETRVYKDFYGNQGARSPTWPPHEYYERESKFSFVNSIMLSRGASRQVDFHNPLFLPGTLASLEQRLMAVWETHITPPVDGRAQPFIQGPTNTGGIQRDPAGQRGEIPGMLASLYQDELSVHCTTSSIMTFFIGRRLENLSLTDELLIACLSREGQVRTVRARHLVKGLICLISTRFPDRHFAIARAIRSKMHVGNAVHFYGMDELQAGEAYACAQIVPNVRPSTRGTG